MTKWCIDCGAENRPVLAVGMNEDGDPACAAHMKQSVRVNQPEKSIVMNESRVGHKCPGFEKNCDAIIGPKAELCTRCYARRHYHKSHGDTAKAAKIAPKTTAIPSLSGLAALKADLQAKLAAIELVESLL